MWTRWLLVFFISSVAAAEPLKVMNGSEGQMFELESSEGPFMLEFYFKACPSCVKNSPNVNEIASEYHNVKAKILEIGIDCEVSDYQSWIRDHAPKGMVLNGCDSSYISKYGVTRYPTTIVLKADRTIAGRFVGVWTPSMKSRIKKLLDQ